MSLFKARTFWSLELNQLQQNASATHNEEAADFVAAMGRFSAIGEDQDVIVAGNLRGFMYAIQVPETEQERVAAGNGPREDEASSLSGQSLESRQLLAAISLADPIIDLKCGYFNSALKQSIAVLSLNKLIIYQIKKRQIDLLSASIQDGAQDGPMLIDECLLSHEFELHHSLDLLANEMMAQRLQVLDSHADSCLTKSASPESQEAGEPTKGTGKFFQRSKQVVQQLHLPQHDKLVVQYANQLMFTLVDRKKIVAHFRLELAELRDKSEEAIGESESVGCMPMAFVNGTKTASLIVCLSNYWIYCITLDKLNQQAKQGILERVALNLLQASGEKTNSKPTSSMSNTNLEERKHSNRINIVDLDSMAEWKCELPNEPIHMQAIRRRARDALSPNHRDQMLVSQLIIMSRYELHLFSSSGQQLWSQKFETPLICLAAHTIEPATEQEARGSANAAPSALAHTNQKSLGATIQLSDQLIILLCADCMSDSKSNLLVYSNDQIVWSALIGTKPMQIWRMNLKRMPGFLATLDARNGQLACSYLGTNLNLSEGKEQLEDESLDKSSRADEYLAELEQLDEDQFFNSEDESQQDDWAALNERHLRVSAKLEAANKWPDVQVLCKIDILPAVDSTRVLRNIIATIEFDDLLKFDVDEKLAQQSCQLSEVGGAVQVYLGNCWPDRRESIEIVGCFSLASGTTTAVGIKAMEKFDSPAQRRQQLRRDHISGLVPKSLSVRLQLEFNDSQYGLIFQEETFLLPFSILANLAHIDYASGQGQTLDDILNNLRLKRPSGEADEEEADDERSQTKPKRPAYFCDIFLNLNASRFIDLIDELVESDLICRGQTSAKRREEVILENLNLLAQSLDCRLKYRNPVNFRRQSSEDQAIPVMVSFALKFENPYTTILEQLNTLSAQQTNIGTLEQLIWLHVCDLSSQQSSETNLAEQLVQMHSPEWSYAGSDDLELSPSAKLNKLGQTQVLISIECEAPFPVIFFQQHLVDRFKQMVEFDPIVCQQQITGQNLVGGFENLMQLLRNNHSLFAVNTNLHNSLLSFSKAYKMKFETKRKSLGEDLAQEFSKFQVATSASLSLAKRLPDLSEEMAEQSEKLMALTKQYHTRVIKLVDELDGVKILGYRLSKLPYANNIWLKARDGSREIRWTEIVPMID